MNEKWVIGMRVLKGENEGKGYEGGNMGKDSKIMGHLYYSVEF